MEKVRDKMAFVDEAIQSIKEQGLYRKLIILQGAQAPVAHINGREVVNLSSNNYLGLTTHPRLRQATMDAVRDYGVGTAAARTIIGTMELHERLEARLAEFKGTEAALTFQSGWTANYCALGPILEEGDLVVSDELNHASIVDAIRLTKADRAIYRHRDMEHLRRVLQDSARRYRKTVIVTDGVFSMDGDIAPLAEIADLAEGFGTITVVDDAHALGVLGRRGRGTVDHFDLFGRWDIQVGTLSKAVGVLGGYVACSARLRELLEHSARPFLFSTSHPPAVVAGCLAAIEVMDSEEGEERIWRLWDNTRFFKAEIEAMGFSTGESETPITPVIVGETRDAMRLSDELFAEGVFAQGIGYPMVPRDQARVRTIVTAAHTREHLEQALEAFRRVGRRLGLV